MNFRRIRFGSSPGTGGSALFAAGRVPAQTHTRPCFPPGFLPLFTPPFPHLSLELTGLNALVPWTFPAQNLPHVPSRFQSYLASPFPLLPVTPRKLSVCLLGLFRLESVLTSGNLPVSNSQEASLDPHN